MSEADLDDRLPGSNLPWIVGVLDATLRIYTVSRRPNGTIHEVRVSAAVPQQVADVLITALGGRYRRNRWEVTTKKAKRTVLDLMATMARTADVRERARAAAGILLTMGKGPRVAGAARELREELAARVAQRRMTDDAESVDTILDR